MKRYILMFTLVFMLIPLSSVFAIEKDYKNGLLDILGENDYSISNPEMLNIFDNDLTTYGRINYENTVYITFQKLIDIDSYFIHHDYISNNTLIIEFYDDKNNLVEAYNHSSTQKNLYVDVDLKNIKEIHLNSRPVSTNMKRIYEFDIFGSLSDEISYEKITNLTANKTYSPIQLKWDNPINEEFQGVKIKQNGVKIADISTDYTSYEVSGLEPETEYSFDVYAKYPDGALSGPTSISIKTDTAPEIPPLEDVKNVKVKTEPERVDLSWHLPDTPTFKHVNIYRDEIKEETSFIQKIFIGNVAHAASTKIFETNGTYFNDLTVKPDTEYEYTLKTTDGAIESEGVTVQAITPPEPPPEMGGVDGEKQENGDYLYTWTNPTDGQVKIIVAGKEYATIPASAGSFLIPAADMKYTSLGDPDVSLQPISKHGTEGPVIGSPKENLNIPFTVNDLIESGNALLWLVSPFILLALAFLLVPKLRNLIIKSLGRRKNLSTKEQRLSEARHEGREHLARVEKIERDRLERERQVRETKWQPRQSRESFFSFSRPPREPRQPREQREPREPRGRRGIV